MTENLGLLGTVGFLVGCRLPVGSAHGSFDVERWDFRGALVIVSGTDSSLESKDSCCLFRFMLASILLAESASDWPLFNLWARIRELVEPTYGLSACEVLAVWEPVTGSGWGFDLVGPADEIRRDFLTAIVAETTSSGFVFLYFVRSIADPGRFVRDTPVQTLLSRKSCRGGEEGDDDDEELDDEESEFSGFLLGFVRHA